MVTGEMLPPPNEYLDCDTERSFDVIEGGLLDGQLCTSKGVYWQPKLDILQPSVTQPDTNEQKD
jgi:hypothetical protein